MDTMPAVSRSQDRNKQVLISPSWQYLSLPSSKKANLLFLHPERPIWALLNEIGGMIFKMMIDHIDEMKIAKKLAGLYKVKLHDVVSQVELFRKDLRNRGIYPSAESGFRKRKPAIKSLFLHITRKCNLACPHCYARCGPSSNDSMDDAMIAELCEELLDLGGTEVTLSGGEPFMHPDVEKIVTNLEASLKVVILTNGSFLNDRLVKLIAKRKASVQVSLDGPCAAVHDRIRGLGTFRQATDAIMQLKRAGVEGIAVSCTISRYNFHDLEGVLSLGRRLGVSMVRFLPPRRMGRAASNWHEVRPENWPHCLDGFFERAFFKGLFQKGDPSVSPGLSGLALKVSNKLDDLWCPVGTSLAVDTNGNAYPCAALMYESFLLGNLKRQSLEEIQNSEKLATIVETMEARRNKISICSSCLWKNLCQAGCMALAMDHKGTVWDVDHHCKTRKMLYHKAFEMLAEGRLIKDSLC